MSYLLSDFLNDISADIAQETGSCPPSVMVLAINDALNDLRTEFDVPTAEYVVQMPFFSRQYQYPWQSGMKDILAIRDNYNIPDQTEFSRVDENIFWRGTDPRNTFSDHNEGTVKYLLANLKNPTLGQTMVNDCTAYNSNGTWVANTATSDAANVRTDNLYFRYGSGSVAFDIIVGQSVNNYAEIYNSTMRPVDLSGSAYKNIAELFGDIYLPSFAGFTSFTFRWGSDASNYYEVTVTTQAALQSFMAGWNILGFDWTLATTVGTPVNSAIDYLLFRATFPASMTNQTGLRLNFITANQRKIMNTHWTSDFLVIDGTTLTPKEKFANELDSTSYTNLDPVIIPWVRFTALEKIFTTHIQDADARAYFTGKKKSREVYLLERWPSNRQPKLGEWMDDSTIDGMNLNH